MKDLETSQFVSGESKGVAGTSFSSRDKGEGCPPGALVQGYDSMGVSWQYSAKDVILKGLGSFWRKTGRREEGCGAGRSASDEMERAGQRGRISH